MEKAIRPPGRTMLLPAHRPWKGPARRPERESGTSTQTENGGADCARPPSERVLRRSHIADSLLNITLIAVSGHKVKGQSGEADKQGEEMLPPVQFQPLL